MLYAEYDVIDPSEIRGLLRKSTDSPGRFFKTGHFAMFEASFLRLTGSVFVPVKKCCVSNAKNFDQAQYLKSPILVHR